MPKGCTIEHHNALSVLRTMNLIVSPMTEFWLPPFDFTWQSLLCLIFVLVIT